MSDIPEDVQMNLEEADYDSEEDTWDSRSWATKQQWAWLKRTRPPYLAARSAGHRAKYLQGMYAEFLDEWSECQLIYGHRDESRLSPEENKILAKAVKKRKMQMDVWHRNRDRVRPSTKKLSTLLSAVGVTKKATRIPQARELFSKDRYDTEVKPTFQVKAREKEAELGRKLDAAERLALVKRCTKEAFEGCTEEYKKDVKKRLKKAKEEAAAGRSGRALTDTADRTPQQYQDAINLVPQVLEHVLKPYAAASGWTFSVLGAGPVPEENGKIGSMSAHFGHKENGRSFAQAIPDFEEQYIVPFGRFAKQVFPRNVQQQRSLQASREDTGSLSGLHTISPPPDTPIDSQSGASSSTAAGCPGGPNEGLSAQAPPPVGLRTNLPLPSNMPGVPYAAIPRAVDPPTVVSPSSIPSIPSSVEVTADPLTIMQSAPVPDPLMVVMESTTVAGAVDTLDHLASEISQMDDATVQALMQAFSAADPDFFQEFEPSIPNHAAALATPASNLQVSLHVNSEAVTPLQGRMSPSSPIPAALDASGSTDATAVPSMNLGQTSNSSDDAVESERAAEEVQVDAASATPATVNDEEVTHRRRNTRSQRQTSNSSDDAVESERAAEEVQVDAAAATPATVNDEEVAHGRRNNRSQRSSRAPRPSDADWAVPKGGRSNAQPKRSKHQAPPKKAIQAPAQKSTQRRKRS